MSEVPGSRIIGGDLQRESRNFACCTEACAVDREGPVTGAGWAEGPGPAEVADAFQRCRLGQRLANKDKGKAKPVNKGKASARPRRRARGRLLAKRRGAGTREPTETRAGVACEGPAPPPCAPFWDCVCDAMSFPDLGVRVAWGLLHDEVDIGGKQISSQLATLQPVRDRHPDLLPLPLDARRFLVAAEGVLGAGQPHLPYWLHGSAGLAKGQLLRGAQTALEHLTADISSFLERPFQSPQSVADVLTEMRSRHLSYEGEEVLPVEALTPDQMAPALPPEEHGASIDGQASRVLVVPT